MNLMAATNFSDSHTSYSDVIIRYLHETGSVSLCESLVSSSEWWSPTPLWLPGLPDRVYIAGVRFATGDQWVDLICLCRLVELTYIPYNQCVYNLSVISFIIFYRTVISRTEKRAVRWICVIFSIIIIIIVWLLFLPLLASLTSVFSFLARWQEIGAWWEKMNCLGFAVVLALLGSFSTVHSEPARGEPRLTLNCPTGNKGMFFFELLGVLST